MNWIFFVFQRIVPLLLNDPKNWIIVEKLILFNIYDWEFNLWTFSYDSKNWTLFDMTRRIEPFWMWLKELKFSTESESKNGFFRMWLKEMKFFEYDSKIWNWLKALNLFFNLTHRIEHLFSRICRAEFFWVWLTELNSLFSKMTHRIEHLFLQMTQRIDFF